MIQSYYYRAAYSIYTYIQSMIAITGFDNNNSQFIKTQQVMDLCFLLAVVELDARS